MADSSTDTTTAAAIKQIGSTAKATATAAGAATLSSGDTAVAWQWYTDNAGALPDTEKSGATSATYSGTAGDKVYCVITTDKGTKYRTNTITYAP